ncbi:FecR family protein [Pedobacter nyackensis]|uniref:FecR family protein n=1 Tax=Pedobacter nyackensis TaxID=475255 RepID=UPI00292D631D|nr:FecR domain-containing protein [Pedobacter nyackensis]
MSNEELVILATKITEGKASTAELRLYNAVCESYQREQKAWPGMESELPRMEAASLSKFWEHYSDRKVVKLWPRIVAAAAILLIVGGGFWFYNSQQLSGNRESIVNLGPEIAPGKSSATLKLVGGEKTISTPRGSTYEMVLPDGTKIWLNAATSIKFPSSFAGQTHRKVELLSGEAYFEVAKDKEHPFVVSSDGQEVEVLGTRFNINTYDSSIKTTLFEGSVKVSQVLPKGAQATNAKSKANNSIVLKPGEESVVFKNTLKIYMADREKALAWKSGNFRFDNDTIETVMRQISYWYDVTVVYEGIKPEARFSGLMKRDMKLTEILNILEMVGLCKFRIEGSKVYVSKVYAY